MRKFYLVLTFLFFPFIIFSQTILNPGFEDGTNNWSGDTNLNITEELTTVHSGSKSLDATFNSQNQTKCDLKSDLITDISALTEYTITTWFYDNDASGRANLVIDWYDNSTAFISSSYYQSYTSDHATWQQLSYTILSPLNTSSCKIGSRFYDVSSWDGDCTIFVDDFTLTASPPFSEPTNHVTSFTTTANGSSQIDLTWTDATAGTGEQLPHSYSIRSSIVNFDDIVSPSDGETMADDIDMSDGSGAVNVAHGTETFNWTGLTASTNYYYKIYPYTNYGLNINYKTDGTVPQDNTITTARPPLPNIIINEIHYDPALDLSGDANGDGTRNSSQDEFVEFVNLEPSDIDISGYTLFDASGLRHTFPNPTIVPSGESIVVFGGGGPVGINGIVQTASKSYLALNNDGDDVILKFGTEVVTSHTYLNEGDVNQSIARNPEFIGSFVLHSTILNNPVLFSPGKRNDDGSPLPVELTSFTATALAKGVMLNWSTATEVNNYGFEIERQNLELSSQNSEWRKVGFIEGHGNSNSPKDYYFIDNSLAIGEVSYRLKQIDIDGAYEYSDVVTVTSTTLAKYELYQNHPNPFNPSTIINFTLPEATRVKIVVYNSIGQKVMELLKKQMDAGYHKVDFDGSNLSSGLYIYRLETPNYSKTMKMILLR